MLINDLFSRDVLLHLRLPFSFYLFPVFCFGLSQTTEINWITVTTIFFILHFFIYPASNIYNSYMDKDEESIGALENPPPVDRRMYIASIILDATGLLLSLSVSILFFILILIYILVSKAYSWHAIRLKKYPFASWLMVSVFQGGYTFMLINVFSGSTSSSFFSEKNLYCYIISSLLVGAIYPLTQVYQHKEDRKRGDRTISLFLGINGTFLFSSVLFILAITDFYFYFLNFYSIHHFFILILFLLPVLFYFWWWFIKIFNDPNNANFRNTMRLNKISAFCMSSCFLVLLYLNHF